MPEHREVSAYLPKIRTIDAFRYLKDDELRALLTSAEVLHFSNGEAIVRQGDISEHFFGVLEGTVNVSVQELNNEEVVVSKIEKGDVFGESAIFLREERSASVIADTVATVLRIHRKSIIAFIRANPAGGNKILMVIILSLLNKLKNANQELAFEKQSEIDFDYVDSLLDDFMKDI
ncbi:MAG: cyclic nucleotide-binding domain-containing protein [Pseudomonadota bacterium]